MQARVLLEAGHSSTLIVPLTTNVMADATPLCVRAPASGRLRRSSDLLIDQLQVIDKRGLVQEPLAHLPPSLMREVAEAIREVLELDVSCRRPREQLSLIVLESPRNATGP